jgi:hypothetical protein
MHHRRLTVVLIAATAALAACGSSGDSDSGADSATGSATVGTAVVAVGAAPVPGDVAGSLGDAVEVLAGATDLATRELCTIEQQTIEIAVEAFYASTGADPTTEQDMVDAGILVDVIAGWDLAADGSIVPAPGGACV